LVIEGEDECLELAKKPVDIPSNVKVNLDGKIVRVEGPKGKLEERMHQRMSAEVKDNQLIVSRLSDNN